MVEENLGDLLIKNFQIFWETNKEKPKNLIINRKNFLLMFWKKNWKVGENWGYIKKMSNC